MILLGVAGSVVVFGAATLLSSLVPRPAVSHGDQDPPPELVATLVLPPDFQPSEPDLYMVPDSATTPPDVPVDHSGPPAFLRVGSDQYIRWHERHGGVPLNQQTVRLVLTGRSAAPVLITRIEPYVLSRQPPLHGWQFLEELGGGVPVHYVRASLDCPGHPATMITTRGPNKRVVNRTTSLDLEVTHTEAEELEVTVSTSRDFVRWGLAVTYVAEGELRTARVTDPRLRVTSEAPGTLRTYTFFPRYHGDPARADHPGLVRTPRFDPSRADVRFFHRYNARMCR
jgi:hypothetical protein